MRTTTAPMPWASPPSCTPRPLGQLPFTGCGLRQTRCREQGGLRLGIAEHHWRQRCLAFGMAGQLWAWYGTNGKHSRRKTLLHHHLLSYAPLPLRAPTSRTCANAWPAGMARVQADASLAFARDAALTHTFLVRTHLPGLQANAWLQHTFSQWTSSF